MKARFQTNRRARYLGYVMGFAVAVVCVGFLVAPGMERFHSSGPMNTGHEQLGCGDCHQGAPGTRRQQLQSKVRYLLGLRSTNADYAMMAVDNGTCIDCHDKPNDRHPVFRFFEPRFAEARKAIQPQHCNSCHLEHHGVRVTVDHITFCSNCHEDTKLKNDPVSVSHEALIAADNWESCLGCHDFHGNHIMETEVLVEKALAPERINEYFQGGVSPYSDSKYHRAKEVDGD